MQRAHGALADWDHGEYYAGYYWSRPRSLDQWFATPAETIETLKGHVRDDIGELVASGLLEALPPAPTDDDLQPS